jgi:hypothetical protein
MALWWARRRVGADPTHTTFSNSVFYVYSILCTLLHRSCTLPLPHRAGNPHPTKDQPPGTRFVAFITYGEYKEEPARGADDHYRTATLIPLAKHRVPDAFGAVVPELAVEFHHPETQY